MLKTQAANDRRVAQPLFAGQRRLRRAALLKGTLVFSGTLTAGCTIRDISDAGARVLVDGPQAVPGEVQLIHHRGGAAYHARVAWRTRRALGLEFSQKIDLRAPAATPAVEALKALWLESEPRGWADYRGD